MGPVGERKLETKITFINLKRISNILSSIYWNEQAGSLCWSNFNFFKIDLIITIKRDFLQFSEKVRVLTFWNLKNMKELEESKPVGMGGSDKRGYGV